MAHRIWGCALVCVAFPLEDEVLVPYAVGRKEDTTVFAACLRACKSLYSDHFLIPRPLSAFSPEE